MAFAGIMMDYHLIFMILCLFLFFVSIILIWLVNTKQAVVVSIFFLAINQLFCIISMMGFFSIGYVGYNTTTGESLVMGYQGMQMFYMIFFAMLYLNATMLLIAVFKYMRMVHHEQMEPGSR